jgi:hypothetical protein
MEQEAEDRGAGYKVVYEGTNSGIIDTKAFCVNYPASRSHSSSFAVKCRIAVIADFVRSVVRSILDMKRKENYFPHRKRSDEWKEVQVFITQLTCQPGETA